MGQVEVIVGDITHLQVDAIVNAANEQSVRGGGVCGAIHRAAGPELALACGAIGGRPTGQARITPGFDLRAAWVIHAVGPVWQGGHSNEDALLSGAYRSSLNLADGQRLRSIAFPAISTGIFGFPLERATRIAVETVRTHMGSATGLERVMFVCYDDATEQVYRRILGAPLA